MPDLVGESAHVVMATLSDYHLYPLIIDQQEHVHVPDGTIIEHMPQAGQEMKPHQVVYLIMSRQPEHRRAPQCVGMAHADARAKAEAEGVHVRSYAIPSIYPAEQVIAQIPSYGEPIAHNCMIVYVAQTIPRWYIMPTCHGHDIADVIRICRVHNIPTTVFTHNGTRLHTDTPMEGYRVIHQKPIPGTFIDLEQPPLVQLVVTSA